MAHRSLTSSAFGSPFVEEGGGVDPMSGMANLADVMLVFACGLMLALVTAYNVDLTPDLTEVVQSEDMTEIQDDIEEQEASMSLSGSGYEELGVVYRDPATGKMYMLSESDR